jgi:hypothetical protein
MTAQEKERLQAYILDRAPGGIEHQLNIDYDGKVKLLGYNLEPAGPVSPGAKVRLTMYWESKAPVGDGWNLFTHILDGSGERILNIDNVGPLRQLRGNRQILWPTAWQPGKVYVDEQEFTVPAKVKTRKIQVVAGVWKGDQRLKILSGPKDRARRGIVADIAVTGRRRTGHWRSTRVPTLRVNKLREGEAIQIDGKLDEPAWRKAAHTGGFVQVSTGEPVRVAEPGGYAKLLWNDAGLFVGFDVRDPDVVGGFDPTAKDPHLWTKDTVEIMADPDGDGDNRDYYEIQINPQNLVFDSRFDHYNQPKVEPNGPFGHEEWSAQVRSAVAVDGTLDQPGDQDRGYVVEAMIPWQAFDRAKTVPPAVGDTWRMNFYAMQNNGGVAWSPILKQGNFHKASRFGRVTWAERGWSSPYTTRRNQAAPTRDQPPSAHPPRSSAAAVSAPSGSPRRPGPR